jgi:hypothetical protein
MSTLPLRAWSARMISSGTTFSTTPSFDGLPRK